MRALALLSSVAVLIHTASCTEAGAFPFLSPQSPNPARSNPLFLLSKRQNCPSNHKSCSNLGDGAACCPNNTNCARDQGGNIACCPSGAYCTGVISGTPRTTTAPSTSNTNGGIVLGSSTTPPPTTTTPTSLPSGYSTVPNSYYPNFVAIPQTLSNYQSCTSAFSACQSASSACFSSLAGQNGVTVSGVVGTQGTTQQGVSGTGAAAASSICSSLYSQGCFNIQSTQCGGGNGATQTTSFVNVGSGNGAGTVPRCTGAVGYAAAMGAGLVGVMGLV